MLIMILIVLMSDCNSDDSEGNDNVIRMLIVEVMVTIMIVFMLARVIIIMEMMMTIITITISMWKIISTKIP